MTSESRGSPGEWFGADQVKPRELASNARCSECATGGMIEEVALPGHDGGHTERIAVGGYGSVHD
jgi:hypothetical protein